MPLRSRHVCKNECSLEDAWIAFIRFGKRDHMAGFTRVDGMGEEAFSLNSAMHYVGVVIPDTVAFVCLWHACANVHRHGKQLKHTAKIVKT